MSGYGAGGPRSDWGYRRSRRLGGGSGDETTTSPYILATVSGGKLMHMPNRHGASRPPYPGHWAPLRTGATRDARPVRRWPAVCGGKPQAPSAAPIHSGPGRLGCSSPSFHFQQTFSYTMFPRDMQATRWAPWGVGSPAWVPAGRGGSPGSGPGAGESRAKEGGHG